MTRYSVGANRERRIMKSLAADGWFCVRSAGSHGPVDIVALKRGKVRLIQSKKTGYVGLAERVKDKYLEEELGIKIEVL